MPSTCSSGLSGGGGDEAGRAVGFEDASRQSVGGEGGRCGVAGGAAQRAFGFVDHFDHAQTGAGHFPGAGRHVVEHAAHVPRGAQIAAHFEEAGDGGAHQGDGPGELIHLQDHRAGFRLGLELQGRQGVGHVGEAVERGGQEARQPPGEGKAEEHGDHRETHRVAALAVGFGKDRGFRGGDDEGPVLFAKASQGRGGDPPGVPAGILQLQAAGVPGRVRAQGRGDDFGAAFSVSVARGVAAGDGGVALVHKLQARARRRGRAGQQLRQVVQPDVDGEDLGATATREGDAGLPGLGQDLRRSDDQAVARRGKPVPA